MSGSSSGFLYSALLLHHHLREVAASYLPRCCCSGEGRRIVWCLFLDSLDGLRLFFGNDFFETKIFDLRPAVDDDVSCRAFCFWQTFSPSRGLLVFYQVFHDEGINNGFPLGARVLPDVRGMAPSRELSNHQLSHDSILQLMMISSRR